MKKILCFILCIFTIVPIFTSCSKPPEYAEIEARFRDLVEASQEINMIFFGEGLPTYERVYDPAMTTQVIIKKDPNDPEKEIRTYYYEIKDKLLGRVIAFRSSYLSPFEYVQVLTSKDITRTSYYEDEKEGIYCYLLSDYVEPEYKLYYDNDDPEDYDYVDIENSPYLAINDIKAEAEKIYSKEYVESLYDIVFVGTVSADNSVSGLSARYMEYTTEDGETYFMKSNTFEPMISGKREFDFSSARMVRPSNKKYINIEVDTYLESAPSERTTIRVSLILQDGVWMLDSPTY